MLLTLQSSVEEKLPLEKDGGDDFCRAASASDLQLSDRCSRVSGLSLRRFKPLWALRITLVLVTSVTLCWDNANFFFFKYSPPYTLPSLWFMLLTFPDPCQFSSLVFLASSFQSIDIRLASSEEAMLLHELNSCIS